MVRKKTGEQPASDDAASNNCSTRLRISRNKHWRYISCFHGQWLSLPVEILESLAHQNWTMPSPRLIDPAVFFDVLKIRKCVDEAAYDSVRASTGISNTAMSGRMDYYGAGGGPSSQLSKERIFRIRQKAVGMLAQAFTLDEVAASVASMQATSTIEDVGQHVLKREPSSHLAKYVHFFHEKIPLRGMEDYAPLNPLNEILTALPWEQQAAPLRTRALTQILKGQYDGAALDLSSALRIVEELKRIHKPNQQQLELASKMQAERENWQSGQKDWRNIPSLKEEDQPQSLEMQLLFHRAGVYLTLAWQSVHAALDGLKEYQAAAERGEINGVETAALNARLHARKRVKTNAKRAIKDYLGFIAHFEYTPGLPIELTNSIMNRVYELSHGSKPLPESRSKQDDGQVALVKSHSNDKRPDKQHANLPATKIYPASMLFADRPPQDLPLFPDNAYANDTKNGADVIREALHSVEAVTYHPLLTEALHSLLLAHALLQTSPTELQRHAYNVARLTRISHGYPIFQSARCPARADWTELLNEAKDWLDLSAPWQSLCAPASFPDGEGESTKQNGCTSHAKHIAERKAKLNFNTEQEQQRMKQESILDALSDDRIVDVETFQEAVRAREERAMKDPVSGKVLEDGRSSSRTNTERDSLPAPKLCDHHRGHSISSERAQAIGRWISEAPASMGGKKRRPTRKKKPSEQSNGVPSLTESISNLSVDVDDDVD